MSDEAHHEMDEALGDEMERVIWHGKSWAVPVVECHGNHCHLTLTNPQAAIEVPRLPTRSEVEAWFEHNWQTMTPRHVSGVLRERGLAVEDPEPEVDPAQVDALATILLDEGADPNDSLEVTARRLLASGRVSVKADE